MEQNLKISLKDLQPGQDYQVVEFHGEFDKAGFGAIKSNLEAAVKNFSAKSLIFDFTDLKFINSEGIGYLTEVHAHLVKSGKKLVVIGVNAHVKDVFDAIGINEVFAIFPTLSDFLNSQK